jgi:hypothetical protein
VEDRHERGRAVDHRSVDHLALPGAHALEQRAHHAEREQETAAAEIADQVDRGVGG